MSNDYNAYEVNEPQDDGTFFASQTDFGNAYQREGTRNLQHSIQFDSLQGGHNLIHEQPLPNPPFSQFEYSHADPSFNYDSSLFQRQPTPFPVNRPRHVIRKSRSLPRRKSKYFTPQFTHQSTPILIPSPQAQSMDSFPDFSETQLDPLQRWRDSPPESEPASISAIQRALHSDDVHISSRPAQPMQDFDFATQPTNSSNAFRTYRQSSSAASSDSGASEVSQKTTTSSKSRNRSRLHARKNAKVKNEKETRRFKCTFCCDDFRTKYDWARHEKSLHLDLEQWRCLPRGSIFLSHVTGRFHCAFCNVLDPTDEHLLEHNFQVCDDPEQPTTFHRKDHLVQHLRLVHHLTTMPLIEDWKVNSFSVKSRCGFCSIWMENWEDRTAHLGDHFKAGLTMSDWRGDHDFDPSIAAKVRNAIPPYCIGDESHAIVPFMAGDRSTQDHFNQISYAIRGIDLQSNTKPVEFHNPDVATTTETNDQQESSYSSQVYIDMLAGHLGRFARDKILLGVVPTDEMFQREARRVVYGSESDGWNQTVADNEDWLNTFKGQLGTLG